MQRPRLAGRSHRSAPPQRPVAIVSAGACPRITSPRGDLPPPRRSHRPFPQECVSSFGRVRQASGPSFGSSRTRWSPQSRSGRAPQTPRLPFGLPHCPRAAAVKSAPGPHSRRRRSRLDVGRPPSPRRVSKAENLRGARTAPGSLNVGPCGGSSLLTPPPRPRVTEAPPRYG